MRRIYRCSLAMSAMLALLSVLVAPSAMASVMTNAPTANLGDSFASGEGGVETGPYLPGTDTPTNQCHRSPTSAAQLLGKTRLADIAVDVSCSGATTQNIVGLGRYNEPPQTSRLNSSIKQTYIMIGGNDIGFGTIAGCILQYNCDQTQVPDLARLQLTQLPPKLDQAYTAIKTATPNATHTVVLYPPLLPPTPPTGVTINLSRCPEFNPNEVAIANELFGKLNDIIAGRARAHSFQVINTAPSFRGHDLCSANPFFYRPGTAPPAATYHPNLPARAVIAAYLAGYRAAA